MKPLLKMIQKTPLTKHLRMIDRLTSDSVFLFTKLSREKYNHCKKL